MTTRCGSSFLPVVDCSPRLASKRKLSPARHPKTLHARSSIVSTEFRISFYQKITIEWITTISSGITAKIVFQRLSEETKGIHFVWHRRTELRTREKPRIVRNCSGNFCSHAEREVKIVNALIVVIQQRVRCRYALFMRSRVSTQHFAVACSQRKRVLTENKRQPNCR